MMITEKEDTFSGKKILMIHNGGKSTLYINVCKQLGMELDQLADKPNEKAFGKIAGRLHIKLYERVLEKYYCNAFDSLNKKYDYILVIRGEYTPYNAIKYMREKNPEAKLILYMWDSIRFNHGIESKWELFDKVYTFDRKDYQEHSDRIGFVPLYYCEEYIQGLDKETEIEYDIAFIGTAHGDRAKIVNYVESECRTRGLRMYKYLYCPHLLVYIYNKIRNKDYRNVHRSDLYFKIKPQKEIYSIYNKAKCVLDIEIRNQTGLTMRTIDILGLKKKLITTNHDIVNYDFYNPNNVLIIDRDNLNIDYHFLDLPYKPLDDKIYYKYTVKNWLIQLLN